MACRSRTPPNIARGTLAGITETQVAGFTKERVAFIDIPANNNSLFIPTGERVAGGWMGHVARFLEELGGLRFIFSDAFPEMIGDAKECAALIRSQRA